MAATLHWHPHLLRNIVFAPLTGQLFSAGEEGVVVLWGLESQKPNFIPRVATSIRAFAVSQDGTRIFACCSDNCIRWIESSQRVVKGEVTGLALAAVGEETTRDA